MIKKILDHKNQINMDISENIGILFTLVALGSGWIGWLLKTYFISDELKNNNDQILRLNGDINLMAQKISNERDAQKERIFHLEDEIRILRGKNIDLRKNQSQKNVSAIVTDEWNESPKNETSERLIERLAILKDENSFLKDELSLAKAKAEEHKKNSKSKQLKKELDQSKIKYKKLRKKYNRNIVEYNRLLEKYNNIDPNPTPKKGDKTYREVIVKEKIDYKKLKKLLAKKLPTRIVKINRSNNE